MPAFRLTALFAALLAVATVSAQPPAPPAAPPATPPAAPTTPPAPPAAAPAPAPAADGKVRFETRFELNKPFYQKLATKVEQSLKVAGNSDVPMKNDLTFYFKWTPVSIDKDKTVVKQTVEAVQFKLDIAGQTIDYDSTAATTPGSAANPGLAEFFKGLVGLEFTVTFNKDMVVEKVDGREQAVEKLKGVNPQMEGILKSILSDEAVKEMVDPSAGVTVTPGKAVNESWEKKSTLPLGPIGSYDRTMSYTYKGKDATQKDFDRVEVKPTLAYKAPAAGTEGLPFKIKSGTLTTKGDTKPGYALYDPKTGRVKEVRFSVVMEGEVDVTISSADAKVKIYQDQKTELDTGDTSFAPKPKS